MLDQSSIAQLRQIFAGLQHTYVLDLTISPDHPSYAEITELFNDVAGTADKISVRETAGAELSWQLLRNARPTGIIFRAVPNGHEFTSLLMAILNADGQGKNIPDEAMRARIASLKGPIRLRTYISLTCTNCPDVVQSLNMMCLLHPDMEHVIIDGAINREEVDGLHLQGVPAVFAEGKLIHSGRGGTPELLAALQNVYGIDYSKADTPEKKVSRKYDLIVAGAGPAGTAAAIYSARKGLRVAVVAGRVGGQVRDTVGIENLISVPQTSGRELAENLSKHLSEYPIDVFDQREIVFARPEGETKIVETQIGDSFEAPALIIATGAGWRRMEIPGEEEYIGRGVAFCPHCDGPFYKGKHVAVIGGGNSGIEAAIDLAGICARVTVLEFMPELKADEVLCKKVQELPNVEVFTSRQCLEVLGDGTRVTGLRLRNRSTAEEYELSLDGCFVQIGLSPNSAPFAGSLTTERGQIVVDAACRTSLPGVYAAGDVTTVPYKQIIIAMGEGAKAALAAFDDRIRR